MAQSLRKIDGPRQAIIHVSQDQYWKYTDGEA